MTAEPVEAAETASAPIVGYISYARVGRGPWERVGRFASATAALAAADAFNWERGVYEGRSKVVPLGPLSDRLPTIEDL